MIRVSPREFIAVIALASSFAGSVAAEQTLSDVLELAYETNPTLQAERAAQRAVREQKAQAWSEALPQITAGGAYTRSEGESTSDLQQVLGADALAASGLNRFVVNEIDISPLTAQVDGELVVFNGLRNVNVIRQASARIRAGGAQLAAVEQDIFLRTASAYFDVVRDTKVYEANLNNVEVLVRQKSEADLRFEVGEITRTDVSQAEARLAGARAQLTSAQAQLAVSRAAFLEFAGQAPMSLDDAPALPETPSELAEIVALALSYAPNVIAAKANEVVSSKGIAIAKSAFAPQVSLTSSYQYADQPTNSVVDTEEFSYGVRASIPIFQGGLRFSRVREARAQNDADRRRVEEARRRATAAVTSAWEQLQAAKSNILSAEAQLSANELALSGVRREAQLGARTTLDVLNAEQEMLNASVSLANAERDARVATFSLLANAGLLTSAAVGINSENGDQNN